jgi:hypothetical protein
VFSRVKGAMPRLVAMFPRLEEEEGEEEGAAPEVCGMDLITIPYAAEVRDIAALKMGTTDGEPVCVCVLERASWQAARPLQGIVIHVCGGNVCMMNACTGLGSSALFCSTLQCRKRRWRRPRRWSRPCSSRTDSSESCMHVVSALTVMQ